MSKSLGRKDRKALADLLSRLNPDTDFFIINKGAGGRDFQIVSDNKIKVGTFSSEKARQDAEALWAFFYVHFPHTTFDILGDLIKDNDTCRKVSKKIQKQIEYQRNLKMI